MAELHASHSPSSSFHQPPSPALRAYFTGFLWYNVPAPSSSPEVYRFVRFYRGVTYGLLNRPPAQHTRSRRSTLDEFRKGASLAGFRYLSRGTTTQVDRLFIFPNPFEFFVSSTPLPLEKFSRTLRFISFLLIGRYLLYRLLNGD